MIQVHLKLRRKGAAPGSYAVEGIPEVTHSREQPLAPLYRVVLNDADDGCHLSVDYFHKELREWRASVAFYRNQPDKLGLDIALADVLQRLAAEGFEGVFAEGIYAPGQYSDEDLTRFPYLQTDIQEGA